MSSGVHVLDFVTMTIIIRMTWYGVQQIRKHTITATETYIEVDKDNQWRYLIALNFFTSNSFENTNRIYNQEF